MAIISKADINKYWDLIKGGNSVEAVQRFIEDYILPVSESFKTTLQRIMSKAESVILPPNEVTEISMTISSKVVELKTTLQKTYSEFITNVYADGLFDEYSITNPTVKRTIKNNTIELFKYYTNKALGTIHADGVATIRTQQTQLLIIDEKIKAMIKGELLPQQEIEALRQQMIADIRKTNPAFYKMTEDGEFVRYNDGTMHTLDSYTDMCTRTTVLNTDRNAVEINQAIEGNRVVEYYLKDDRKLKGEPREVCEDILTQTLYGVCLVATDQNAADILDIPLLSDIKDQGAMGPNCRHSIRPAAEEINNKINKLLYLAEEEAI